MATAGREEGFSCLLQNVCDHTNEQTFRNKRQTDQLIELSRPQGALRASELAARGISRVFLKRLCDAGMLELASRDVYVLADRDVTQHHGLVLAPKRVPRGVIMLLSALQFHGLGTPLPHEVWMAIDCGARKPRTAPPPPPDSANAAS
jgi:hypothetical protein